MYREGMPSREYWAKRAEELLTESFKKAETVEKYLVGIYRSSLIKVSNEYSALVKPFLDENGELDIDKLNQARQFDLAFAEKYRRLEKQIQLLSENISEKEEKEILELLEKVYKNTFIETYKDFYGDKPGIEVLNKEAVRQAVMTPWTKDGREFSDRIWSNKNALQSNLRRLLSEAILNGESPRKTLIKLNEKFGAGASNCQRLIRTETNAIYNKAAKNSYEKCGVEKVEILAALDSRTSKICEKEDGNIVALAGATVGVDLPPFHPNCRSTFFAVLEEI